MSTDVVTALRIVDEMKSRGVVRFTVGDVSAEFATPEAKHVPAKAADEDLCACGHSLSAEHMSGCCVAVGGGCDPTKCSPEKA